MNESAIWQPNVTVAAIAEREGRFLMVREMIDGKECINQPAGHLEADESLQQAVIRETMEETAFQFTPTRLCGIYRFIPDPDTKKTYLRFAFAGELGDQLNQALDKEIIGIEWTTPSELEHSSQQHRSPMVMQCVLDYLHKPSYPLQVFSEQFV